MAEFEYRIERGPGIVEMRNSLVPLEGENRSFVEFWIGNVFVVANRKSLPRLTTPLWLFIEELNLNDEGHSSGEDWNFRGITAKNCWTPNTSNEVEGYYTPKTNGGYIVFLE